MVGLPEEKMGALVMWVTEMQKTNGQLAPADCIARLDEKTATHVTQWCSTWVSSCNLDEAPQAGLAGAASAAGHKRPSPKIAVGSDSDEEHEEDL